MTLPPCRVLVVDDDPTVRVLMRTTLVRAGFEVVLAGGGNEALARFDEGGIGMLTLDVDMPDLDGLQVCRAVRARAGDRLPILMVTGMDDVGSVDEAYRAGATDFIAKPIPWALFAYRVQYLHRAAKAAEELARLHAHSAAMLDALPDLLLCLARDGTVRELRRGAAEGDDGSAQDLPRVGEPLARRWPEALAAQLCEQASRAIDTGRVQRLAFAHERAGGRTRHAEASIVRIDAAQALCLVRDMTAHAEAQAALQRSERRLAQAQEVAGLGSWYLHAGSGAMEWSTQARRMFGVGEGEALTRERIARQLHEDDAERVRRAWAGAQLGGRGYACEYRVRAGDGGLRWLVEQAQVERGDDGALLAVYGTVQDITERKEAEYRIARLAYVDGLTGMPNRLAFMERLEREVRRAAHDGRRMALLFLDLDGFKTVNDTLGHDCGDRLLQQAADRLRAVLRAGDIVSRADGGAVPGELARLGGDEFTAIVPDLDDPADALGAAQRVLAALREPFIVDGRELSLSGSIGIAVCPEDGADAASLLKHADTAMYHAKERGRDNCQFYSAALTERALARMTAGKELRCALEQGEFHLVFQPQFDVRSGRVTAAEALLRWNHPQRGVVPPAEFIPLAEANGLIVSIGRWVLRRACEAAAGWRRAGLALRIAVNLSPLQLRDPGLVETVRDALAACALPPSLLEIELTEGALMDDTAATTAMLDALRSIGVRVALDDFGTGYSSMGYLKRLAVDCIKIDRSFVQGLPADRDSLAIVHAIVSMSRSLGFEVTAEGVETPAQHELLARLGCDVLQGYLIGRPQAAESLLRALRAADAAEVRPASTAPATLALRA
ncbi:MAG: EAL domain-containing protein [Burkholderiales bacterium]|nr:EAL domain-containing protein [Burkholderiales bacterium]